MNPPHAYVRATISNQSICWRTGRRNDNNAALKRQCVSPFPHAAHCRIYLPSIAVAAFHTKRAVLVDNNVPQRTFSDHTLMKST
jgi:hypothetical protein